MSKYSVNGLTCIDSHETCPMILIGTVYGCVFLLDATDQLNLHILAKYYLTSTKIVGLKFIRNLNYFTAIDDENYHLLIKRQRFETNGDGAAADDDDESDDGIQKIMSLPSGYIDYSSIGTNDGSLHCLLLFVKNDSSEKNMKDMPNCFAQYIQIHAASNYGHQMQSIPFHVTYNAMQFQYFDTQRFAVALQSTDIHIIELMPSESGSGKIETHVVQTIPTTHSVGCSIRFTVNAASILTYGDDGQCLLWDKSSMRLVKSVLAHNKCRRGVKDAIFDSMQR